MSWMLFVVAALCIWRASVMLVEERGPWDVFVHLREKAGIEHDDAGVPVAWKDGLFASLLQCVWCTSVWVAAAYVILYVLLPQEILMLVSMPFALSAAAILIDSCVHKG